MAHYYSTPSMEGIFHDIHARLAQVEGAATALTRTEKAEALGEVSTTSDTPVDLGGPSVSVWVEPGLFVNVFVEVEAKNAAGTAVVVIHEPTYMPNGLTVVSTGQATYKLLRPQPGSVSGGGELGTRIALPPPPGAQAGLRTYSLRYHRVNGEAFFRNRRLWATVSK